MRLLDTESYALHEFFDADTPCYAILSHRWSPDETNFQDYRKKRNLNSTGHRKIIAACDFARDVRNQQWLWIDTCCIDKKSSAELSEAINSMYDWYGQATECYAYLEDVRSRSDGGSENELEDFANSAWFTRGWTLQELIAPARVLFCNISWQIFGHKTADIYLEDYAHTSGMDGQDLISDIHKITSIPVSVLRRPKAYRDFSTAQRLCWASSRITRRTEDEAYCLLGLLDVHMPLLYGERQQAFVRLQQEIIKNTTDETILAWDPSNAVSEALLADSPCCFRNSETVRTSEDLRIPRISIQSGLVRLESSSTDECYVLEDDGMPIAHLVRLRCVTDDFFEMQFVDQVPGVHATKPCMIMLSIRSCGHHVRVKAPNNDNSLGSPGKWQRTGNITFYIHNDVHGCFAGWNFFAQHIARQA